MSCVEPCFSAPLEMGTMVLGPNQDTIFQLFPAICPSLGPPADKMLGLRFPLPGPPRSRAAGPLLDLSWASPLAKG